jgi:hypothetical protein
MDYDEFFEKLLYGEAVNHMNEKGKYKLANWLAHGFEIKTTRKMTVIERGDETLLIDGEGNIYDAKKAI